MYDIVSKLTAIASCTVLVGTQTGSWCGIRSDKQWKSAMFLHFGIYFKTASRTCGDEKVFTNRQKIEYHMWYHMLWTISHMISHMIYLYIIYDIGGVIYDLGGAYDIQNNYVISCMISHMISCVILIFRFFGSYDIVICARYILWNHAFLTISHDPKKLKEPKNQYHTMIT
jgi:hypothetical protein